MLSKIQKSTRRYARSLGRRVLPVRWRHQLDLRDELRMLDGELPIPNSGPRSVVFFTVHKCASTYMQRVIRKLATQRLNLRPINMARYYWRMTDGDAYEHIQANAERIFHPHGFMYGPLRQPVDIPELSQFKTVLMLRDPRDVLTSFYYSVTTSHGVPETPEARRQFLALREKWTGSSVDGFVLGWLPEFQRRYEGYLRLRADTGCRLLRYEDMLADFDRWAIDLGDALDLPLTPDDVEELRVMGGFQNEVSESANRHIRQRTPGDHLRKLAPETVERLNDQLSPVLEGFGYT